MRSSIKKFKFPKKETQERRLSKELLLFLGILTSVFVTVLFVSLINFHEKQSSQRSDAQNEILGIETQKGSSGFPMRLKIPKLQIDTLIEYVATDSDGKMEAPSNTTSVGWFRLGPVPGQTGSAVIAGHFNGENGEVGVFNKLGTLQVGDKVYVQDTKGSSITFIIRESRTYDPGHADEVFNRNDGAHLNLITCDGEWDEVRKSYNKRLVVFADRQNL